MGFERKHQNKHITIYQTEKFHRNYLSPPKKQFVAWCRKDANLPHHLHKANASAIKPINVYVESFVT
jgi:hypothetical protein